jgi:predicted DCC family thiol-disulfide oxidoreductase YuxK
MSVKRFARQSDQFALLYDSDCAFCSRVVCWILRWDRRKLLRAVPIASTEATRLAPIDPALRARSWHLISPSGRLWSAGEAIAPLMRLLPGGGPIATLASTFPGATNATYWFVVRHRDQMGRVTGSRCVTR